MTARRGATRPLTSGGEWWEEEREGLFGGGGCLVVAPRRGWSGAPDWWAGRRPGVVGRAPDRGTGRRLTLRCGGGPLPDGDAAAARGALRWLRAGAAAGGVRGAHRGSERASEGAGGGSGSGRRGWPGAGAAAEWCAGCARWELLGWFGPRGAAPTVRNRAWLVVAAPGGVAVGARRGRRNCELERPANGTAAVSQEASFQFPFHNLLWNPA